MMDDSRIGFVSEFLGFAARRSGAVFCALPGWDIGAQSLRIKNGRCIDILRPSTSSG